MEEKKTTNMGYKNIISTATRWCAGLFVMGLMALTTSGASAQVVVNGNVFGGGNAATVSGNTTVLMQGNATVNDCVYGGGAKAAVGTQDGLDATIVTIEGGRVNNSVYGGGLGDADHAADLGSNVTVNIGLASQTTPTETDGVTSYNNVVIGENVFGANNQKGTPEGNVVVNIYHTAHNATNQVPVFTNVAQLVAEPHDATRFAIQGVYGGGNKADYKPAAGKSTTVTIFGCENTVKMVYGGGRAAAVGTDGGPLTNAFVNVEGGRIDTLFAGGDGHTTSDGLPKNANNTYLAANIFGNATAAIHGGYYTAAFAGSNTSGNISGTQSLTIDKTSTCSSQAELIGSLFGGGNMADITGNVSLTVACGAGEFNEVYGGANMANITGNVTLNVYGGTMNYVYGGSKGTPAKAANITGNVTLNLFGGTLGSAFGGSNVNGNITGTITVNVNDQGGSCPLYVDNVYGSGNLALYEPTDATITSPVVNLRKCTVGYTAAAATATGHAAFDIEHQEGHGCVFGGGKGTLNDVDSGKVTANPKVVLNGAIDDSVIVLNTVFGGGEIASVVGSTTVQIFHGHVGCDESDINHSNGFVFGGGKGDVSSPLLGCVSGNSTVTMSGGYVHNTLFGGGQLGSVGDFTTATADDLEDDEYKNRDFVLGEPISCAANTGKTTVTISGGQVGPHNVTMHADLGYVFGAGMGYYTQPYSPYADPNLSNATLARQNARYGYVDNTEVTIRGTAFIVGAVWGGSENGQVLHNCVVKIQGGQIGCGDGMVKPYDQYDKVGGKDLWERAKAAVTSHDEANINAIAALMPECKSWPYAAPYLPYDPYAPDDGTEATNSTVTGDGHTFFGNVFGGGSGYYPYRIGEGVSEHNEWFPFQGRVRGNTYLYITGGHILTSAYGGCEYADVSGDCYVEMNGGTLGVPRSLSAIEAHPVTCYLFGAGKGDQRTTFNMRTNVRNTYVTVGGDAMIYGSIFGGGEDGHVSGNAEVNVTGNAIVGTFGTSYVDGNIFGGGRGFGGTAITAGSIGGNVTVNISNDSTNLNDIKSPHILGSVYGGGRLASVGVHLVETNDPRYGLLQGAFTDNTGHTEIPVDTARAQYHGNITINITGGTIGNHYEFMPDPFSPETAYVEYDVVLYQNSLWRFIRNHPAGAWNYADVTDVVHTTGGNVFGSSMGRLLNIGTTDGTDENNFNHLWPGLAKCRKTDVTIGGNAVVHSNVYGGGELGYVMENSKVTISGSAQIGHVIGSGLEEHCFGSVFGGGYGSDNITQHTNDTATVGGTWVTAAMHAGRVYGNAEVLMTGGHVQGNIYGGGELASVGRRWINMTADGAADSYIPNTTYANINDVGGTGNTSYGWDANVGNTTVTISGGQVGDFSHIAVGVHPENPLVYRYPGHTTGKMGSVFGGGKGRPGRRGEDFHFTRMAYVDSTNVTISGTAQIAASVFGGSENGHVRYGTLVNMTGGTIGLELDQSERETDDYGYSPVIVYHGNIYGGGRGIDNTDGGHLGEGSGQVFGNTRVTVSGGTVRHNVYGGGSLATVGCPTSMSNATLKAHTGKATVVINGTAVIGANDAKGLNSGRVFGSGRGMAGATFADRAYTNNTYVTIGDDNPGANVCYVNGAVFGSGENGHVENHTHVYIKNGCEIGQHWAALPDESHKEFVGNVYGGGSGVDLDGGNISRTAGLVHGSTHVTVSGGKIYHNVYGGGSLGSVGDTLAVAGYATYADTVDNTVGYTYADHKHSALTAKAFDDATANGHAYIYISGGKIGTDGNGNGNVFGGGRGNAGKSNYSPFIDPPYEHNTAGFTEGSVTIGGNSYTTYHKTVKRVAPGHTTEDSVISYRETTKNTLGYSGDMTTVWVIGAARTSTSTPYTDSVVVRDYTNHTFVTGSHIVVNYPSVDSTTSYVDRDFANTYNTSLSNTAAATSTLNFIRGNVFGGGDNGHVRGNTEVYIQQGRIGTLTANANGNVFGGGRGEGLSYDGQYSDNAGKVYGNTNVDITGGWILHNVYGGGNLSSVGDFTVTLSGAPSGKEHDKDAWLTGQGTVAGYTTSGGSCNVTIKAGTIGEKYSDIMNGTNVIAGMDAANSNLGGNVFGSSRGQSSLSTLVNRMAYVNNTVVTIDSVAKVHGSVFGGGENGHVFYTARVNMKAGTVGVPNTAASGDIYRGNLYGGGRGIDPVGNTNAISRNSGLILGNTYLDMTGGTVYHNVFGGGSMATVGTYTYKNGNGADKDQITALQRDETGKVEVTVTGGTVGINGTNNGRVFGAGRGIAGLMSEQNMDEHTFVDRTYVTVGGTAQIKGCVFGSGDNGHVLHNTQVVVYGGTIGTGGGGPVNGNVFGSGRGADTYLNNSSVATLSPNAGRVYGNTDVYIVGGTMKNNVYGGGYLATVDGNTNVTINTTATVTRETYEFTGGVPTPSTEQVTFPTEGAAGTPVVYGDVFGGSALGALGNESGTTTLNIYGGTIGSASSYKYSMGCGNIYGGGNGDAEGSSMDSYSNGTTSGHREANVLNTVTVNIGNSSQYNTPGKGPKILGNVFGCNNIAGCPKGNVDVNIYSTKHTDGNGYTTGDVYPATLKNQHDDGATGTSEDVLDSLDVAAAGGWNVVNDPARFALTGVYGGGNQATYAPTVSSSRTKVTIFECQENTIYQVYGGGKGGSLGVVNHANAEVLIYGGHFHQVFAGGNGAGDGNQGANVANASITIHGGIMQSVFGGSNSKGTVTSSSVEFKPGSCDQLVQDVFGGGNQAPGAGDIVVTIPCGAKGLTDVYGCSNAADFTGNVTLNILGGTMKRAFGGAKNADIKGNVTVNAFAGNIGELYGGNNAGGYIFGDDNTKGNIVVNVDFDNTQCPGEKHIDFVYGGGNNAPYKPDGLTVETANNEHTITNATGTNNPARISPVVNIISGYQEVGHQTASDPWYTVDMAVFGGGKGAPAVVKSNPKVVIGADRVQQLDGNLDVVPVSPAVQNLPVRIGTHEGVDGSLQGNVFGGGNAAAVEGSTKVVVKGSNTRVYNNVYGGGNAATVTGNTDVQIGAEN